VICCFIFFAFALVPEVKSDRKSRRHSQSRTIRQRTRHVRHRAPGFNGILDNSQHAAMMPEGRVILVNNPEIMSLQETMAAGDLLQQALINLEEQRRAARTERQKRLFQEQQLIAESKLRIEAEKEVCFLTSQLSIIKEKGRVTVEHLTLEKVNLIERMDRLQNEIKVLERALETDRSEEDAQLEQLIQTLHSGAEKLHNDNINLLQQISVLRQENISLKNSNAHLEKECQEQSKLQKQQQVIIYERGEAADEKDNHEIDGYPNPFSISPEFLIFGSEETQ